MSAATPVIAVDAAVALSDMTAITITGARGLDPINVFMQDLGPNKGRITIECFGRAWSGYWGAMGCSISEFLQQADAGYLCSNLVWGIGERLKRAIKNEDAYLERIVLAIQQALRKNAAGDA